MLRPFTVCVTVALMTIGASPVSAAETPTYERDVRPIFAAHCFRCHGAESQKAELSLTSATGVRKGGESGAVVEPGQTNESPLYQLVLVGDMPPEEDKRLTKEEVATIAKWIDAGAKFATDSRLTNAASMAQHNVLPILYRRCVMCHGPEYQQGQLDVRSRAKLLAGGVSGPALAPGKPDESLMVIRLRQRLCPPQADIGEAGIEPITSEEFATLEQWIAAGAPYKEIPPDATSEHADPLVSDADREFWSLRPPTRVRPPTVAQAHLVRSPVDAFLLSPDYPSLKRKQRKPRTILRLRFRLQNAGGVLGKILLKPLSSRICTERIATRE